MTRKSPTCRHCHKPLKTSKTEAAAHGGRVHMKCRRERQRGQTTIRISPKAADRLEQVAEDQGYADTRLGPVLSRIVEEGLL